jgi:hypothetical protein
MRVEVGAMDDLTAADRLDLDAELLPPADLLPLRRQAIAKVGYSHEAMADMILADPTISQDEIAARFGYTAPWISQIICSDAFKSLLARRRDKFVDPIVAASIKQQFEGLASRCLEVLRAHTKGPAESVPPQLAMQALKVATTALGYGARPETTRVEINVTAQLEMLGSNLEALLVRKRGVTIDASPTGALTGGEEPSPG